MPTSIDINRAGNEYTLTKLELHYADTVVESFTHTQVVNCLLLPFQCPLKRVMRLYDTLDV